MLIEGKVSINDAVQIVHETAKEKGWYESKILKTPLECHMLMVSEIAEASEEVRKGTSPIYFEVENTQGGVPLINGNIQIQGCVLPHEIDPVFPVQHLKPEGELIELADTVIRIMDYCGYKGWDLEAAIKMKHNFNTTRPTRHGGKLK